MLEAGSFVLYFNQGKHFVIRENSGKNQGILFSILAGYPVKGLLQSAVKTRNTQIIQEKMIYWCFNLLLHTKHYRVSTRSSCGGVR
jgi:hypothetical protein